MKKSEILPLSACEPSTQPRTANGAARRMLAAALLLACAGTAAFADNGGSNCNSDGKGSGGNGNCNCSNKNSAKNDDKGGDNCDNNGDKNGGDNNGNGNNAFLPNPVRSISTMPANGDQNPYGVAFVPSNFAPGSGPLHHGDILVSNFNNSANLQGTGTTIVQIPANGMPAVFFQGSAGQGLSTALGTLRRGFVLVGNAPTTDGSSATAQPGSLLVIDATGTQVQSIANAWINYPWDMALVDRGNRATAFVSNALDGTVNRLDFYVTATGLKLIGGATVASGYVHRGDPAALFVAPTGLVYDQDKDVLYVASTGDNAVYAVHSATTRKKSAGLGKLVYQDDVHLHGALGLAEAPNGHLLVTNNDTVNSDATQPSEIVEFTKDGEFVKEISVDPMQGGSFGLAVNAYKHTATFAAVDDVTANLMVWTLPLDE